MTWLGVSAITATALASLVPKGPRTATVRPSSLHSWNDQKARTNRRASDAKDMHKAVFAGCPLPEMIAP
jgi:hypothetical protein